MASNNISIPDIKLPGAAPAAEAPAHAASSAPISIPDIKLPTNLSLPPQKEESKEEGSWGDVIGSAFSNLPTRFDRAWQGIKQGISISAAKTAQGVTANNALSVIDAAKKGVESATAKLAALGYKPSDFDEAPDASFDQKRERNERFRGLVDKLTIDQLQQDPDFVAARDEGLRLSGEIAANTPHTKDWSAKDLVSQILAGGSDMAPSILAGVITKSPTVALAGMTPQAYGMYMQDGVDKGLDPLQAERRATVFAALEPLTEALPVGLIMRKGAGRLTDLGISAVAEGAQEGVTQMLQDAYDVGQLDEKMTLGQFLSNAAKSAVVGSGVGAGTHGTLHAGDMINRRSPDQTGPTVADEVAAAQPERATVPEGEYDAAAAELGSTPDAADLPLPEAPRPSISPEDYAAYKAARDAGSKPQDALDQMQRTVQDDAQNTVGGDALDALVTDSVQPRDATSALRYGLNDMQIPAYLRQTTQEVNGAIENAGAPSPLDLVQQQVEGGPLGLSPQEMSRNLLPAPGQTSTIALPGQPGMTTADQPQRPRFSMRDRADERAASSNFGGKVIIPEITLPEPVAEQRLALPAPGQTSTIALPGPGELQLPQRPRFSMRDRADERAASTSRPNAREVELPLPPARAADVTVPENVQLPLPPQNSMSGQRGFREKNQEVFEPGDQFQLKSKVGNLDPDMAYTVQGKYGDALTLEGADRVPRTITQAELRRAGVEKGLPVQEEPVASEGTPTPAISETPAARPPTMRSRRKATQPRQTMAERKAEAERGRAEANARIESGEYSGDIVQIGEGNVGSSAEFRSSGSKGFRRPNPQNLAEQEGQLSGRVLDDGRVVGLQDQSTGEYAVGDAKLSEQEVRKLNPRQPEAQQQPSAPKEPELTSQERVEEYNRDAQDIAPATEDAVGKVLRDGRTVTAVNRDGRYTLDDGSKVSAPYVNNDSGPVAPQMVNFLDDIGPFSRGKWEVRGFAKNEDGQDVAMLGMPGNKTLAPVEMRRFERWVSRGSLESVPLNDGNFATEPESAYYRPVGVSSRPAPREPSEPKLRRYEPKVQESDDPNVGKEFTNLGGVRMRVMSVTQTQTGPMYTAQEVGGQRKTSHYAEDLSQLLSRNVAPSVKGESKQQGMKPKELEKAYRDWSKGVKGLENVGVTIIPRQADIAGLPENAPAMMAFYDPGRVQMVAIAENINTPEEAHAQFRHELVAHYGLRARLSKPEYDRQMDRILAAEGKDKRLDSYFKEVRDLYGDVYDLNSPDGQRMIAEEVVASVAENAEQAQRIGVVRQVIEALRKMMVKAGILPDRATFNDVADLVKANTDFLRQNRVDNDDVRRSIAPMKFQMPNEYAPSLRRDRRVEDADVPGHIKDGMRKVLHAEEGSVTDTVNAIMDKNTRAAARQRAYQGIFDDLNPIAELEKGKNNGELRQGSESAYKLAANSRQINSIIAAGMTEGVPMWDNGGIKVKPNSKGLLEIFNPIAKMKGNQLALWEYWAGAVRGQRLIKEGRENLYTQQEIDDVINYVNGKPELRKAFNTAHKEYQQYKSDLLDFAQESGIIDPAARQLWDKDDYVPLYRVADDADKATAPGGKSRSFVNQSSGIKTLRGGTGKVDIVNNILQNASHLIMSSYNNRVGQMITELADGVAMEEVPAQFKPVNIRNEDMRKALNELGVSTSGLTRQMGEEYSKMFQMAPPAGKDIVSVMFEGKRKYYEVTDPNLMRAINHVGPRTVQTWMKLFTIPKTILTRAVTATPDFVVRNITRDILGNYVQQTTSAGRNGMGHILADSLTLRPIRKALQGAYRTLRSDEQVKAYKAAGGFTGGYDGARPDALAKQLRALQKGVTIGNAPKKAWQTYEHFLESGELGTRMAVFDDVYKRTGDITEATYQANDVLNFSRRGDFVLAQFLMNSVPFMNARVQGLDRLARGAKDNWKGFVLKGAMISAATMALMAMNKDDERYWAMNEAVRDNYWVIPVQNGFVQVPKPFEVGSLFGTVLERAYEAASRDDKVFWDRMLAMFGSTFAMNPIPQSVSPIVQDIANKDFFMGRPIVSEGQKFKDAPDQFDSYTAEIVKDLSRNLPDWFPDTLRSPTRLQHLLEAYTGSMGQYAMAAADGLYREGMGMPDRPARAENDIPGLNIFLKPDNKSSKYITRAYEMQAEVRKANAKLKDYREAHDADGVRRTRADKADELQARHSIETSAKRLTELSKKSREVMADPDLTAAEKREKMDALTVQKNAVAKQINDRWWRKLND